MPPEDVPRYQGPLSLETALSKLALAEFSEDGFTSDGPRADVEYRDLGLAAATDGRIGARHIRAIRRFPGETGWHWHDMTGHFVFVLKGWITFAYAARDEPVTVRERGCLSQPAGVPHNVLARSDDLELIEINIPATFAIIDAQPPGEEAGR